MEVKDNILRLKQELQNFDFTLVAVSKTKPNEMILEAYDTGQRDFGENKVQEIVPKFESLPKDIKWHFIGHLQRNKVKYIAPFVHLIHSVDSLRLLNEINKQAIKTGRIIPCLLQIYIAKEESKFGLDKIELFDILNNHLKDLKFIEIQGLMGMATLTEDDNSIVKEFTELKELYDEVKNDFQMKNLNLKYLSMGMSSDYQLALNCGSNMIRLGSTIFGARK